MELPGALRRDMRRFAAQLSAHINALYPDTNALNLDVTRELLGLSPDQELPPALAGHVQDRVHRTLVRPVRHLVDAGGQRWRPYLLAKIIHVLGGDSVFYTPLLAAGELMHTGSLIIDDVQDEAPVRRGRAAAHTVYGTPTALNAGTAAFFAFDRALRRVVPDDVVLRCAVQDAYLSALRAAHAGQALDILGLREEMDTAVATGNAGPLLDQVRLTHRLKSGAPVRAAFHVGALLVGSSAELSGALQRFGEAVGTAYQITDDVLDLRGVVRAGAPTKSVAEDLRNGKVTMPLAHAVALLPRRDVEAVWHLVRDGHLSEDGVREAIGALETCGAVDACVDEAERMLLAAWEQVKPLLPGTRQSCFIHALARHTVRRVRVA
ncbi:polyprenyl synthetase family protein [Streptomyces sp. MST-110588]|uniref:polyprenyl synthetase family protein n=1 Tax=Streptomyces sp. MST-110588 TaxID=2833628 RepID=UPI001F5D3609|nr:polyprenyl synthetase family protein [Streptomyces sp. MST-110588]UNO38471.1 polyprenyl synthetase family protein [Streptomyces sp. MST-110588]